MFARIRRPDPTRGYREVTLHAPGERPIFVAAPGDDTSRDPRRSALAWAMIALPDATLLALSGWRRMGGAR